MSRNRFQEISEFLHFADNSNYDANESNQDKLYKVRYVVEFLIDRFKTCCLPAESISVNEELLLWKGRLSFKQYIPSKRARFGIKLFSLCEDSGYLWNSFVYLGKTAAGDDEQRALENRIGKTGLIVANLANDLLGLGYKLYVDNWYTSEALFQYLYENKTCAAGTARKNRLKLPTSFKQEKLQRGQFAFRRNENMLAVRYQDKKEIYMLSTMHKADSVNVNRRNRRNDQIQKPTVIHDYNQKMGGVDKNDAMIGNYSCIRKSYKWYTKIFFHFLEEAVYNAFVIYDKVEEGKKHKFMQIKLEVVHQMLQDVRVPPDPRAEFDSLNGRHFRTLIPATQNKEKPQKRRIFCYKNNVRRESRYHYDQCVTNPGLCAPPCFLRYHTLINYEDFHCRLSFLYIFL